MIKIVFIVNGGRVALIGFLLQELSEEQVAEQMRLLQDLGTTLNVGKVLAIRAGIEIVLMDLSARTVETEPSANATTT